MSTWNWHAFFLAAIWFCIAFAVIWVASKIIARNWHYERGRYLRQLMKGPNELEDSIKKGEKDSGMER